MRDRGAVTESRAFKIYVCNVMTQPGETTGFTASDHVRAIEQQAGERVLRYVLVNTEHRLNPSCTGTPMPGRLGYAGR